MGRPPEGTQALKEWLATRLVPVMKPGQVDKSDYVDAQVARSADDEDRKFLEEFAGRRLIDGSPESEEG